MSAESSAPYATSSSSEPQNQEETVGGLADQASISSGRDIFKKYHSETSIAIQHIKTDILSSRYRICPERMIYAAISAEGNKSSASRPVMTKGGRLSAPKTGGMCSIAGPFATPTDSEGVRTLLSDLFKRLKASMKKVSRTDTKARLQLKLINQRTKNVQRILPSYDPFEATLPHVKTLFTYLDEVVYKSHDVFPDKMIPLIVVFFDIDAKPPRCEYEILPLNNPVEGFSSFKM